MSWYLFSGQSCRKDGGLTMTHITSYKPVMGGRMGTAVADYLDLVAAFGDPRSFGAYRKYPGGHKVTVTWTFETPRGLAELRDYWWNGAQEWTIAAASRKPAMYLARELRRSGFLASTKFYDATQAKPFLRAA